MRAGRPRGRGLFRRRFEGAPRLVAVVVAHPLHLVEHVALVAPLSAVDTLVTDTGLAAELVDEIEAAGPRVVRA